MYASSGENSCVGATSSVSLEGERENSFQWEKWSRMPNAASAVPANKQELQTKACLNYYITIIHGNNTSHAVTAVI